MAVPASSVEAVVIGAGVVGLAVTRALSLRGKEVILVDRASSIGTETSSRNSEVVHAGLYYPSDTLKAKCCVRGRTMLYEFCESRSVPYKKIGKLVVATDKSQFESTLPKMQDHALRNGVNTQLLSPEHVQQMEPAIESYGALWSPSTGIVDSHSFMMCMLGEAEDHGATLITHANVEGGRIDEEEKNVHLHVDGTWISCGVVVNSAGLWADRIAAMIHKGHSWQPPKQYFAKGNYFQLQGKSPFSHLIYPVPDKRGGLGVHATLDANNQVKFGPDVEWLDPDQDPEEIDLIPDPARAQQFYQAIRKYWPDLPDNALVPDYSGIRPKLLHPNLIGRSQMPFQDFQVLGPDVHGVNGLVHLFGMESPGLTSALAISDLVAHMIDKD